MPRPDQAMPYSGPGKFSTWQGFGRLSVEQGQTGSDASAGASPEPGRLPGRVRRGQVPDDRHGPIDLMRSKPDPDPARLALPACANKPPAAGRTMIAERIVAQVSCPTMPKADPICQAAAASSFCWMAERSQRPASGPVFSRRKVQISVTSRSVSGSPSTTCPRLSSVQSRSA